MRTLQVYNVLGALTERVWLEVPLGLAERGITPEFWCEQVAPECPAMSYSVTVRGRVAVIDGAEADVVAELERLADAATVPPGSAVPDVIHGHTGTRFLQVLGMVRAGVPCVISLYGYDASRLLRSASWGARYRWAAGKGVRFVVLGEAMRHAMMSVGVPSEALTIIRLGIDTARWAYEPADGAGVVAVGRLVEKKGFDTLITAVGRLKGVKLKIVGDGPLRDALEHQALRDAPGRVEFAGRLDRADAVRAMREAGCLAVASRTGLDGDAEGTPIVMMEALAVGTPVVSADHGCCAEVVPESYRAEAVAKEGDVEGLAWAIERVLGRRGAERRAIQAAGRAWVEGRYELSRTIDAYESLYGGLGGHARKAMATDPKGV